MNMLKKLMRTIFMTAAFVLVGICMMPMMAKAETITGTLGYSVELESGEAWLTYTYDDSTKTLVISGIGRLEDIYSGGYSPSGGYAYSIVSFDSTLSEAETIRFSDCTIVGSAYHAFQGFTNVNEIDLSGLNTSVISSMSYMFYGCSGLESLDLSGFDNSNVTNMSFMFGGCTGLKSLNLSGFDTSNVTNMRGMFTGCSALTSIDVGSFDTSKVTDMGMMFTGCSSLTGLDVSGFDTSNVTQMIAMFNGCSELTSLDLSSFDTAKVYDYWMATMFYGCSSLKSLDLSSFDTSNVTDMSSIFSDCYALEEIKTPKAMSSCTASLPAVFYDADMYENGGEYRTTTELSSSFLGTTLKRVSTNGWESIDGVEYWYEDGVRQGTEGRGKEIYDQGTDAWYWLDAEQGGAKAVSKDVYQESDAGRYADNDDGTGKWCRYDEDGKMVKGWDYTDAGTYYFDETTGAMAKGYTTVDGKEYYFNTATGILESGGYEVPETGWLTIDGSEYWYEDYYRQGYSLRESYRGKEIFDPDSEAWYWLDNVQGGAKAVSKDVYQESDAGDWAESDDGTGKWVRYDENGHMIKGWQTNDAGTYYFDYTYGTMAKGTVTIDGTTYYFDESTGILQ